MSNEQLNFNDQQVTPRPEPPKTDIPVVISRFPGPGSARYHLETLTAYLTNAERLTAHVQTIEDWRLVSAELLDNIRAAQILLSCTL